MIDYDAVAAAGGFGKGPTRARVKGRKARRETSVKTAVRRACVERDGYCRLSGFGLCEGPSEWMHLEAKKRARTRGQAPEERHTMDGSMMACRRHHHSYDAGEIELTLGPDGADGPISYRRKKDR